MGLTVFLTRILPTLLPVSCLGIMAVLPPEAPPWLVVAAGMGAVLLAFFLIGDALLNRWLRSQKGREVTPMTFLLSELAGLLFAAGVLFSLLFLFLWHRLDLGLWLENLLLVLMFCAAGLAFLALVAEAFRRFGGESKNPNVAIRRRLAIPPLKKQIREAWDFQWICGPRLIRPLVLLWGTMLAVIMLAGAISGGVIFLVFPEEPVAIFDYDAWPTLVKISVFLFAAVFSWSIATGIEATFRIVNRVRRAGRIRPTVAWREVGVSMETVGFFPTIGWGVFVLFVFALILLAGFLLNAWLTSTGGMDDFLALTLSGILVLVLSWLLIFLPQMYVMAVLMRRDCGWFHAFGVSVELVNLEGREAVIKALVATFMGVTIIGIPGAVHLLTAGVEKQDLLISAILGEKTPRQIEAALTEEEAYVPAALKKHFDQLSRGRYLDALNGFQLYIRNHPENIDAMRGQGLALLYIGNRKAREIIERWEDLDPEAEEPKRILKEMADGLWFDGGRLYDEAQKRCTQPLGRGV